MNSTEKYLVICGRAEEFLPFVNKKLNEMWTSGDTSLSLSNFIRVNGVDQIRGRSNPSGWFIGTWYERNDARDILAVLASCVTNDFKKHHRIVKMYDRVTQYENQRK